MKTQKTILELSYEGLEEFFLQDKSYCNIDLPQYIKFNPLLSELNKNLGYDDILKGWGNINNYTILMYKNKENPSNPIELINPVIYCLLIRAIKVNFDAIKAKFDDFKSFNDEVECLSIPTIDMSTSKSKQKYRVLDRWKEVEEKSIKLSLDFDYIHLTNIENLFSSISTRSIPKALLENENPKLTTKSSGGSIFGNEIDRLLQYSNKGQTTGIPQGCIMMDFLAEIVLGNIDKLLTSKLGNISKEYKIIRYKSQYRIFTNTPAKAKKILDVLSDILAKLGIKSNLDQTINSKDIIISSISKDKLDTLLIDFSKLNFKKQLLVIKRYISDVYPNSVTLNKMIRIYLKNLDKVILLDQSINNHPYFCKNIHEVNDISKRFSQFEGISNDIGILSSILTDLAIKNPKIYPYFALILNRLLTINKDNSLKVSLMKKMRSKFEKMDNTEYLDLWLQAIALKTVGVKIKSNGKLFKLIEDACEDNRKLDNYSIWDFELLNNDKIKKIIKNFPIIDIKTINDMPQIIPQKWLRTSFHYNDNIS